MRFFDGLGRRPAQDVVGTTRFVVGACFTRKESAGDHEMEDGELAWRGMRLSTWPDR